MGLTTPIIRMCTYRQRVGTRGTAACCRRGRRFLRTCSICRSDNAASRRDSIARRAAAPSTLLRVWSSAHLSSWSWHPCRLRSGIHSHHRRAHRVNLAHVVERRWRRWQCERQRNCARLVVSESANPLPRTHQQSTRTTTRMAWLSHLPRRTICLWMRACAVNDADAVAAMSVHARHLPISIGSNRVNVDANERCPRSATPSASPLCSSASTGRDPRSSSMGSRASPRLRNTPS